MKKEIAMRCTKEHFEAIKPKLEKEGLKLAMQDFSKEDYLVNNFLGIENRIANMSGVGYEEREVHETWNEKVFLEACGISTIPTLEEVKEYFKDAKTLKSEYDMVFELGEIFKDFSTYSCKEKYAENCSHTIWSKDKGYAEILTYKEKTYSLTKEQLRSITDPQVKNWFPEVFETVLEVGKWYISSLGNLILNNGNKMLPGIVDEEWAEEGMELKDLQNTVIFNEYWKEATESEVFEALKNEAVKRGYKKGNHKCLNSIITESQLDDVYELEKGLLWYGGKYANCVFKDGQWAEIIPTKTKAEAEKELNCKIID